MNLTFRKYLVGTDTFIRHLCLSHLSKAFFPSAILDVGGEGFFRQFVKARVTSVNVKAADVRYSGVLLPFKDNSFDIVVSCDTLEHISKQGRERFLSEFVRVSRKGVVLCAPLGTLEHIEAEKTVVKSNGLDPQLKAYLEEHIAYGLPTPEEVAGYSSRFNGRVWYQGDFRKVSGRQHGGIFRYLTALKLAAGNLITDAFAFAPRLLKSDFGTYTNRFFLVTDKTGSGLT